MSILLQAYMGAGHGGPTVLLVLLINSLLKINIPKREEAKVKPPRQIEISS